MKGSWRTTTLGVIAGVSLLLQQAQNFLDSDPNTHLSYEICVTALAMIGQGLVSRDDKVSSEQAGVKK